MLYELFYLVGASRETDLEKIKNAAEQTVKNAAGVFQEKTTLEKRRLSYVVKHETHGIYIACRFELEKAENLKEITSKLNLNSDILRFIISRADELPQLRSKEERISEAQNIESGNKIKKEEKLPPKKEEKKAGEKKAETPEGEKPKEEDIDKKLEEILNI